jgi:short-subunit dehydrogenase
MAVYFATKAFVLSFTDALHEEVRGKNVKIMSLCPGPVETGFQQRAGMKGVREVNYGNTKSADQVAAEGWAGFKAGARVVIPGAANKLAAYGTRGAPRRLILPFIRRAMGFSRKR